VVNRSAFESPVERVQGAGVHALNRLPRCPETARNGVERFAAAVAHDQYHSLSVGEVIDEKAADELSQFLGGKFLERTRAVVRTALNPVAVDRNGDVIHQAVATIKPGRRRVWIQSIDGGNTAASRVRQQGFHSGAFFGGGGGTRNSMALMLRFVPMPCQYWDRLTSSRAWSGVISATTRLPSITLMRGFSVRRMAMESGSPVMRFQRRIGRKYGGNRGGSLRLDNHLD
jgi:hypothetical protein